MNTRKTYALLALVIGLCANTGSAVADITGDTNTVLDWAEKSFPAQLPTHQATQTVSNWLYREYQSTDFYTGVNTQDNGVYYITGKALRNNEQPIFFKSVATLLSDIKGTTPATKTLCDARKLPTGHSMTGTGNALKVSTNGCIPEPLDDADYCPQQAAENGISILRHMDITSVEKGVSDQISMVSCSKNVSPEAANFLNTEVSLDLCYNDRRSANNATIKGKIVFEKVDDCLKSNAETVKDLSNDDFWIRVGDLFQKL